MALLLMGYSFVTQLFPAVICSLFPRNRATKQGAFCGILAGVAVVAITTTMHLTIGQLMPFLPDAMKDVNIGFVALAVNVIVFVIVSAMTQSERVEHARIGALIRTAHASLKAVASRDGFFCCAPGTGVKSTRA